MNNLPCIVTIMDSSSTKGDWADAIYPGLTYDCALPQDWLNQIASTAPASLDYHALLFTIVYAYPPGNACGLPAALCRETRDYLHSLGITTYQPQPEHSSQDITTTHDPYDGQTRKQYLSGLAEDFGVDLDTVLLMADLLGPNEDFDGLVTTIEDYADGIYS